MYFKRWISIENHYRDKFINMFFLQHYDDLIRETFVVTEKVDGANFSIIVKKNGEVFFAKRSGIIGTGDNFYSYQEAMEDQNVQDLIKFAQEFCIDKQVNLQFIGELFGQGVQKRIQYGDHKQWRMFGIYAVLEEDKRVLSRFDVLAMHDYIKNSLGATIIKVTVPTLETFTISSQNDFVDKINALDIRRDSLYTPDGYDKPNLMEGVVVRPFHHDYFSPVGEMFIIKKKNPEYLDNPKTKEKKEAVHVSEEITNILHALQDYVNENRSQDLFSKFGEIERPSEIGKYIGLYYEDIINDYEKDNVSLKSLDKKDRSFVNKSLNKIIVGELQRWL